MGTYLWAFDNFEQNTWAQLLLMAEFAYNNVKNISTGHIPFKFNYEYHLRVSFEEGLDSRSRSILADELSSELWELMTVYCKNLFRAQELQKRTYDKDVKPKSYAPGDKVCLNNKYIKTK